MTSPDEQSFVQKKATAPTLAYKGAATYSWTNPNNYTDGMLMDQANPQIAPHDSVRTTTTSVMDRVTDELRCGVGNDQGLSASNPMSGDASSRTTFNESSSTSELEIHSSAGVRLDESEEDVPRIMHHQTKAFEHLAAERGIAEWNNRVLDGRWLGTSGLGNTSRVEGLKTVGNREHSSKAIESASRRHKRLISLLKELDDTEKLMGSSVNAYRPDPAIWGLENTDPHFARAMHGQESSNEYVHQ